MSKKSRMYGRLQLGEEESKSVVDVSFEVDDSLFEELDIAAEKLKWSRGEMLSKILEEGLKEEVRGVRASRESKEGYVM